MIGDAAVGGRAGLDVEGGGLAAVRGVEISTRDSRSSIISLKARRTLESSAAAE